LVRRVLSPPNPRRRVGHATTRMSRSGISLGAAGDSTPGAAKVADVGPIPRVQAAQVLLRINEASGPPGSVTPVHSHPGSEAFYVLAGEQTIRGVHETPRPGRPRGTRPRRGHGDAGLEQRDERPACAGDVRGGRRQAVLVARGPAPSDRCPRSRCADHSCRTSSSPPLRTPKTPGRSRRSVSRGFRTRRRARPSHDLLKPLPGASRC